MPTKALIPLPTEPHPDAFTCVRIAIPNDSEWKAMFWGALDQLTRWNSYDRDEAHTGKDVANQWLAAVETARERACVSCPNFYADFDSVASCDYTPTEFISFEVPGCDACDPSAPSVISVAVAKQTLQPDANVGWVFRDINDDTVVGGRICRLSFASVQPTGQALPHVVWKYIDCLGTTHETTRDATFFTELGLEGYAFCFTCSYHFSLTFILEGPILCTIT